MQDARGVAGKLTEAGKDMCEHGAAAAHALRQHGEHPALEFHQGAPTWRSGGWTCAPSHGRAQTAIAKLLDAVQRRHRRRCTTTIGALAVGRTRM